MGGEKHGSKGGRGFLQLFDWNAKSRKKLFSGKSDLPGITELYVHKLFRMIAIHIVSNIIIFQHCLWSLLL